MYDDSMRCNLLRPLHEIDVQDIAVVLHLLVQLLCFALMHDLGLLLESRLLLWG